MPRLNSTLLCNGVVLISLAVNAGTTYSCSQVPQQYASTNAVGTPLGARALAAELIKCPDDFRPLRVGLVIDNTGSNGARPGEVQRYPDFAGSDPVKSFEDFKFLLKGSEFEGLNTGNIFTYRQYAAYKAILKLQNAGLASRKSNPEYAGIDIGVAHFPKASSSTPTEQEMSEPVYYNGNNTGLPTKMSDLSQIANSQSFKQKIWDMLKFTHDTNGMTPYVTAFKASKTLLVDEKKPEDDRQGLMILITDGLPTDRKPSSISAARENLGETTRVALISIFDPTGDDNEETQNSQAKVSLAEMFAGSMKWGQEEHSSFGSYWNALLAIPNSSDVRDDQIKIRSDKLNTSLDGLLERYLACRTGVAK